MSKIVCIKLQPRIISDAMLGNLVRCLSFDVMKTKFTNFWITLNCECLNVPTFLNFCFVHFVHSFLQQQMRVLEENV